MAFDSIVAYVILFSLGISAVVGIAFLYKDYVIKTTTSLDSRQDILDQKGKADLQILNITYSDISLRNHTITSKEDFALGIFDETNKTLVSGNLNLEWNGTNYSSIGNWSSQIIDLGHKANLTEISINMITPDSTWLGIQIRSAENSSQLISNFLGPDGTENTYYESSQSINSVHREHQVFQLRVYFTTTNTSRTSELEDITVSYKYLFKDVELNIENSGKIKLDKNYLDIFVDKERIPRDYDGLSFEVVSSSDYLNPGIWDPDEILRVSFPFNMTSGKNVIQAVNEFSTSDYLVYDNT
jgi:hypothetical protein